MDITREYLVNRIAELSSLRQRYADQYNACIGGIETLETLVEMLDENEKTAQAKEAADLAEEALERLPILARD